MERFEATLSRRDTSVARIEILPLRLWLRFNRAISRRRDFESENVEWVDNPVLLRIESSSGCEGFARVRVPGAWLGETTSSITSALRDFYGPALLGSNILEREANIAKLAKILPGNPAALSAVDIALHDLIGKTLGLPIYSLLGGSDVPIPLDWSVSLRPPDHQYEMVAEAVRAVKQYGVQVLCMKAGPSDNWRSDIDNFRAIRAAVGSEVEIGMDPNEGYDLPTAVRVLRTLKSEDIAYVEQPFERSHLEDLAMLRSQVPVPVFVDESAITIPDAYRVARGRAADGIVLKIWKTGSIASTLRMAAVASVAGLHTTIGGTAHGNVLEAAAFAHLFASAPVRPMAGEFILGLNVTEDEDPIAVPGDELTIRDGHVRVPQGPGLGVSVNIDVARELALSSYVVD